ncbi:MAG: VOC family protein [Rhizobiales bacterium]|nr:VOC family protein [Hyphomicrobiales bacterium]
MKLNCIAPIIPVADVAKSAGFYRDVLGFEIDFVLEDNSYGVLRLQGQEIHLTGPADAAALAATCNNISVYFWVQGIEDYYAQASAANPGTKITPIEDRPWGMREFHIHDLDGALLRIGETLPHDA